MQTMTYTTSSEGSPSVDSELGMHAVFVSVSLVITIALLVIVHVVLAQAVANDVRRLEKLGRRAHYLGSAGWGVVVLFLGIVGLGAHWVMHYSTFRDVATDRTSSER